MNFTGIAVGLFGGTVVAFVATQLARMWNRNKAAIAAGGVKGINSADKYLEEHWGIDLINEHTSEAFVTKIVAFIDTYAKDKAFWRKVLNNMKTLTPAKFDTYVEQLKSIDWSSELKDQVASELLAIINRTKKEEAVALVKSKALMANVVIENVPEKVEAAVVASKILRPTEPITKELMERLARESAARKEVMRAKMSQ